MSRIGVLHPAADELTAVEAEIRARVVRAELNRRLGDVAVDLRIAGDGVGPWLPQSMAAWPTEIDAVVDLASLPAHLLTDLVALFPRTLDPAAVEVRRSMLRHLAVLPESPYVLDDVLAFALQTPVPRPTDLWIAASGAVETTATDPLLRQLGDMSAADTPALDAGFDQLVADLGGIATDDAMPRVLAQLDDVRADLDASTLELRRVEREADERLAHVHAELQVLRDRLARAEFARADPADHTP